MSDCPISIIPAPQKKADSEQQIQTDQRASVSAPNETQPQVVFLDSPHGENKAMSRNDNTQEEAITNTTLTTAIHVEQELSPPPVPEGDDQKDSRATSVKTQRDETPSGTSNV